MKYCVCTFFQVGVWVFFSAGLDLTFWSQNIRSYKEKSAIPHSSVNFDSHPQVAFISKPALRHDFNVFPANI